MAAKRNGKVLKLYIFILLYSTLFRLILGRWGTIIADFATAFCFLYCIYESGNLILRYDKIIKTILILIFIVQVISLLEIFNANILNHIYALIEYRKSYFQLLCFFPAYWLLKRSNLKINDIIKYIGLICLPIILYGIKQKYFWGGIDSKFVDMTDADTYTMMYKGFVRSVSIFSGPFHFGLFSSLSLSIYLYLWRVFRKSRYLIQSIIALWGCYCSITRTNLICCVAVLIIFYFDYLICEKKKNTIFVKIISISLFSIVFIALFNLVDINVNIQTPIGQIINSFSNLGEDQRFTTRIVMWVKSMEYIFRKPFIGYGIGAAADTMGIHSISKTYITSHNMFLKLFLEIGIVGGLLYICLFFIILVKIFKAYTNDHIISCAYFSMFMCIMLNSLVGSTIASFPNLSFYWIISALLLANYSRKENMKLN